MAWGRGGSYVPARGQETPGPGSDPPSPPPPAALWVWPPECPLLGFLFPEIPPTSLLMALGKSLPLRVSPLYQVTGPPSPFG